MKQQRHSIRFVLRGVASAALIVAGGAALAQGVSIANSPLTFTSASAVRPNLMFVLDDSGSMTWDYMPDTADFGNRCFGYHGLNKQAYNPGVTYKPPLQANGTSFPDADANWPKVKDNGFDPNSSPTNLNNAPITKGSDTFYYAVLASGVTSLTACPASNKISSNLSLVTSLSSAERTNYANWWSYYRTRLLAMKSGVGRAFAGIDAARFRVGYSTIHESGYSDSNPGFLTIRDFDATNQKANFFSKLYAQTTSSGTPLRPALEKQGRMYAGVTMSGAALPSGVDPVTHSCQRNYTLLSTDGYWNNYNSVENSFRASYAPQKLDGTPIGNQDGGTTPRPMLDDGKTQGNNWVTNGSGVADTLADIAAYFYATDLRTSNCIIGTEDVCVNDIKPVGNDTASHQHMTTYTLGLGVSGKVLYQPNYDDPSLTQTNGVLDFVDIKNGSNPWPNPMLAEDETRIDDLWHAAVNGRGRYYSAADPDSLINGLGDALDQILAFNGQGAAAATSSLEPVAGDNFVYRASYTTQLWEGNVEALSLDPASGAINRTPSWQARNTLAAQVLPSSDTRAIYIFDGAAANKLRSFTFTNLSAAQKAYFENLCLASKLTQCATLAANNTMSNNANSGANVVNYLRGQTQHESSTANAANARVFRSRTTPLGDVVNAAPAYVKKPPFRYGDSGYASYASAKSGRTGMVYVAANDGMLHAFDATTGAEVWAYIPSMALPNLYRLADENYAGNHRYFVDGTPVVGDIWNGSQWRTILVGGLNAGGRGYYVLDITDPANPAALWEFSSSDDADLGFTFGNPIITKNKAGTWVVMFSSGYNNVLGSGNGQLFVRNAWTGASVAKIPTMVGLLPAGTASVPSNLGKITAWLNSEGNNTATRVYGGDMLGHVWRFDFDDNLAPSGSEAQEVGRALSSTGTPQPITTKLQVFTINGVPGAQAVAVGTGRLLGSPDFSDKSQQSLYVFKDSLTATSLGSLRSATGMVQQPATRNVGTAPQAVNWGTDIGWYVDLSLTAGERVNVDMIQTGDNLVLAGNIPTTTACTPGGSSWTYVYSISSGAVADAYEHDAMVAGYNIVRTTDGALRIIRWDVIGRDKVKALPPPPATAAPNARRTTWRELID